MALMSSYYSCLGKTLRAGFKKRIGYPQLYLPKNLGKSVERPSREYVNIPLLTFRDEPIYVFGTFWPERSAF